MSPVSQPHLPTAPPADARSRPLPGHAAPPSASARPCERAGTDEDKGKTGTKREEGVAVKERTRTKKPPLYRVLLHNDDYTTKEFVVAILQGVFQRSESEAVQIMMVVHQNGVGVAGIYTYEIAETKVQKTLQLARSHEYPLQLSLEPEE